MLIQKKAYESPAIAYSFDPQQPIS